MHAYSTDTRLKQSSPRLFKSIKFFLFDSQKAKDTEFVFSA